jgi:hypothetical protein
MWLPVGFFTLIRRFGPFVTAGIHRSCWRYALPEVILAKNWLLIDVFAGSY